MRPYPSQREFANCLHTTFAVREPTGGPAAFELIAVRPGAATPTREEFSLLFRAARTAAPAQGLYTVRHAVLGSFSMFLVPVGTDADHTVYEAVFNLLL